MWKDLTMSQRADMMDLYLSKGITSLDDMRSLYDSSISDTAQGTSFSDGGSIHIKPENRGKFTALKKRTGHSATWFKEHGTPAQKKMATFALNARHWKHGYGGHIYDGTSEDTQQMNIPYAGELPDVTVMPRRIANKSWDKVQERWVGDMPTYYAVNPETGKEEMLREIGNGKYSTYDDRHVFDVLGAEAAKKEREQWIKNGGNAGDFDKVMLGTLGLGLAPIALPEIAAGVGTALTNPYVDAGLTSYFGAHGLNHAINEGIDGWGDAAMTALELAPLGRLVKPMWNAGKAGLQYAAKTPQITAENAASVVSPQNEGLVVSAVPDYRGEIRTDYNLFRRFADRGIPQKTVKSIETPSNNIDLTSNILIDPDKRFMMFEPGKFINHDIGAMSVEEVVNTFGPEAEYYKKLYDVAKAHNFEGKYAKIGQDAEYNILNRFAINKADPDVAKGIAEARGIYDIPEYRARFNRWGTLGDTFVDDALARIDNVKLQGRSKNLDIKGQHGVHGGAYTSPDATTIGITNSESSSWITDNIRHEANHVGHGLNRQPGWMRYHNEKIRPIVREGKTTDTPLDKYYDEMDEIVERSKTAVEYANKIRKEGETLDQALTRLADMTDANIYNAEIPADIRQSIARHTKDSVLNFWKNFVGGYAAPIGLGLTGYGLYNSGDEK